MTRLLFAALTAFAAGVAFDRATSADWTAAAVAFAVAALALAAALTLGHRGRQ